MSICSTDGITAVNTSTEVLLLLLDFSKHTDIKQDFIYVFVLVTAF